MRIPAITLAVIALLVNVFGVGIYLVQSINDDGQGDDGGGGDDAVEQPSDLKVLVVPEPKVGDQAIYDYTLFAQMYWANYSSGEWQRYTFTGDGEYIEYIEALTDTEDGFKITRSSLKSSIETKASFELKIEGSDVDTAVIPGSLDLERSEFTNIFDRHALKAMNSGSITIENLGSILSQGEGVGGSVPAELSYNIDLRTYPDPAEEPIETIDQSIYGNGRILTLNSHGTYSGDPVWGEDSREYNWSVEGAYMVRGHDSFKVNVSSDIWDFLFFNRTFYISPDSPFPVKGFTRTNTSYKDATSEFFIVVETDRIIKDSDFAITQGAQVVPWGDPTGHEDYVKVHPAGEFQTWGYVPADGSDMERSTFNGFSLNQAVDYAIGSSVELQRFLSEFEAKGTVLVRDSVWNSSSDLLSRNTTTWWNLTFSYVYSNEELWAYYEENEDWPEWSYRILVARSAEKTGSGTMVSRFISKDEGDDRHGRTRGGISKESLQVGSDILTTTHAEKIMRIDDQIEAEAFEDKMMVDGVYFYYGLVGFTEENAQGLILLQQLTGIKTPTADNAYSLQKETVWETGGTFSTAVDANTGQLLYVTTVEGNQLASIFGG